MLATAIGILDATKDSIFDDEIMGLAGELHERRNELSDETFAKYLFMYSTALSDLVTKVCLSKEEMSVLCATIDEMDNLSETILEEDK